MANCNDCTPCENVYEDSVCAESMKLKCSFYSGDDIESLDISSDDNGDEVVNKIATAITSLSNLIIDATEDDKGLVNQTPAIADVSTTNASDLATAITLVNSLKTKINAMLAAFRTAGIIAS